MPDKPYNMGQWTVARMRSFIMSALRRAQWPPKYKSINKAFVKRGPNPKTGKMAKLHECPVCNELYAAGNMHADHKEPVIPVDGQWGETTRFLGYNWNEVMMRLYIEEFDALCKTCHKKKTNEERQQRKHYACKCKGDQ